ncbi:hypothetical protein Ancab_017680 [Ancistrocladus abbreviatus]
METVSPLWPIPSSLSPSDERATRIIQHGIGPKSAKSLSLTPSLTLYAFDLMHLYLNTLHPLFSIFKNQEAFISRQSKMRSPCIIFYCILSAVLYIYFRNAHIHPSVPSLLTSLPSMPAQERISRRELRTYFTQDDETEKTKVFDEEMQRSRYQEGYSEAERETRGQNESELIYHIDYHGVMTHPTPTPKHPKPHKTIEPLNFDAPPSL